MTEEANEVAVKAGKGMLTRMREGLFHKNGVFSKTAFFFTLGNGAVLIAYVLSWLSGSTISLGDVGTIVIPAFDVGAAAALIGIVNGTYLGNNALKAKERNGNGGG